MRVPRITIFNDKFLWNSLHQRMRNMLFLNYAFNICKFRKEKRRFEICHFRLICRDLFYKVATNRPSHTSHCSRIMQPNIPLWFPFLCLFFESVVVSSQIIKKYFRSRASTTVWTLFHHFQWYVFDSTQRSSSLVSINHMDICKGCGTEVY